MKKVVTVKDIAKKVGVSTSTVSRVLNDTNTAFIGKQTREKVLEAANELGYSPNLIARALAGKQTYLLGVIVREISDPFFAKIIAGLSKQARDGGYQLVLGYVHSDPQEALEMSSVWNTQHLDGVFALGDLRDDNAALKGILKNNHAVVAIARGQEPDWLPKVNINNDTGIRIVLDYLHQLGHRQFAFLDGGWLGDMKERREAFEQYMQKYTMTDKSMVVQASTNDAQGGYLAMEQLLASPNRPTAVIAADDLMALGALKKAQDAGIVIPGEMSIVGFDDIEMGRFVTPTLTTVRQPVEAICKEAMRLMQTLISNKSADGLNHSSTIEPELIIRESSGTLA